MWSTRYSCQILIKCQSSKQIFKNYSNIKFHENPSSGCRAVPCSQTDMTKLIVAFHSFANTPHKTPVHHEIYDTDHKSRLNFVNCYLHGMNDRQLDPTLVQSGNKAWLHINRYRNSQNNRYQSVENPVLIKQHHYMALMLLCGVLLVQRGHLLLWEYKVTPIGYTFPHHFWIPIKHMILCLFSATQRNSSHCKKYKHHLQWFWWQILIGGLQHSYVPYLNSHDFYVWRC
jgi:hypothetical protein